MASITVRHVNGSEMAINPNTFRIKQLNGYMLDYSIIDNVVEIEQPTVAEEQPTIEESLEAAMTRMREENEVEEKPFACHLCGHRSKSQTALNLHIKRCKKIQDKV